MDFDVFISHSTKDKTVADATCALLESRGIRCWIAPRDIELGDDWPAAIMKALRGARIMVLIFSSHANTSPQILREVERAVHAGATIIPMRIEDVVPQDSLDYFLGTPHWLDAFTPPLEAHLEKLAVSIRRILGMPPLGQKGPPASGLVAQGGDAAAKLEPVAESGVSLDGELVELRRRASAGDVAAAFELGQRFHQGKGVTKDYALAEKWYQKAADQGYAAAQYQLGWIYEFGQSKERSYEFAPEWYKKAAIQGYAPAQERLAFHYKYGVVLNEDIELALEWYQKSAKQGYAFAQYCLGQLYEEGKGVTKDIPMALEWYKKAAAQGESQAAARIRALS